MRRIVLFGVALTLIAISFLQNLPFLKVKAQGGLGLQLPFTGTYRINSYVDHETPFIKADNPIKMFNGEEYNNCPGTGTQWTTQGPYCYDGHEGIDWAMGIGTQVLAAASGTVAFKAFDTTGYGYTIRINHENGYQTRYAHLKNFSDTNITINVGDQVTAGTLIALSGDSGNSGGPHLHLDVPHNNFITDPFGWRGTSPDPLINYSGEAAACLWANEWCSETIVEDGEVNSTGTVVKFEQSPTGWSSTNWSNQGNSWTMKYVTNGNGSTYAYWRPRLSRSGSYQVLAYITTIPGSLTSTNQATYRINDQNGDHYVTINQATNRNQWVSLGTYSFRGNSSTADFVQLTNNTGEASGTTALAFDTLKFRQFFVYLPLIVKNWIGLNCTDFTQTWYPVGTNTCNASVPNCADGDGQPDGVFAGYWEVGYHQVEFSPQLILPQTRVAAYWKSISQIYGDLYIDVKVDDQWNNVLTSVHQSQSAPGRWEETGIGQYADRYISGIRFGFSSTVGEVGASIGHRFMVDGYRITNFITCTP